MKFQLQKKMTRFVEEEKYEQEMESESKSKVSSVIDTLKIKTQKSTKLAKTNTRRELELAK